VEPKTIGKKPLVECFSGQFSGQKKPPPAEADEIGQQHRNLARLNQSWVGEFPPSSCSEAVPLEHLEEEIIDL